MENYQRIECTHCAERNVAENNECEYCHNKLEKERLLHCPRCGILISTQKDYCKLCSILNAKGGAIGLTYAFSIVLFLIGIVFCS